jgi:hypothetical protein
MAGLTEFTKMFVNETTGSQNNMTHTRQHSKVGVKVSTH